MLRNRQLAGFLLLATLAACTSSVDDEGPGGSGEGSDPAGCLGASGESVELDAQEVAMLDLINGYRADHASCQ